MGDLAGRGAGCPSEVLPGSGSSNGCWKASLRTTTWKLPGRTHCKPYPEFSLVNHVSLSRTGTVLLHLLGVRLLPCRGPELHMQQQGHFQTRQGCLAEEASKHSGPLATGRQTLAGSPTAFTTLTVQLSASEMSSGWKTKDQTGV